MGLGAACGLFNGILVTWGQVPALVVTLGTLYAFRGLAFLWTNGRQVNAETLPDAFLNLGSDSIAGVPILVADRAGHRRSWSASGCATTGPAASSTRSAPTPRAPAWRACARSGACWRRSCWRARSPAWAACSSPRASARSTRPPGVGYELTVIAAAVVGGVAIFGGIGTVYGAALGALLLTTHHARR